MSFIHESSYVDPGAVIGEGTKIWHFSHIQTGAKIGNNCIIGQNVNVGPGVIIGDNVKIQNNVSVYGGVEIEDDAFVGPSVVFTNVINPRSFIERKEEFKDTLVRQGATLGANSTIICGNTIGRYSMIGAGTVVTKNVGDYELRVGVPARLVGYVCKFGLKLEDNGLDRECNVCKSRYYIYPKRGACEIF